MGSIRSSVDSAALRAWRGQLAATGARRGLRMQLLHHRHELLPRFATLYRQLRALPRRVRKTLQRQWGASLAGVALLLTVQPLVSEAANFTAGTAAELVTAITTANGTVEADTITLTADITLIAVDNTGLPYTFSGLNGLPVITSSITIAGQGHTIHRDSGAPEFRLVEVSNTGDLTLQDTTLSGGISNAPSYCGYRYLHCFGGAVLNFGGLTLTNSTVSGNLAGYVGGGIDSSGGLTLTNSTVSSNSAAFTGGGIENSGGGLTLTNSTVSSNSAAFTGGGIATSGGSLTLTNSTVSDNSAASFGGGIATFGGSLTMTNSMVSGNSAGNGSGGGIGNYSTRLTMTNSTVSGNSAADQGGGIDNFLDKYGYGSLILTLTDSTVSGNSARLGGGINSHGASPRLTLTNSTVSGNSAYTGGGIRAGGGLTLTNSTVSDNSAGYSGGGIENFRNLTLTDSTVSGNSAADGGGGIENRYGSVTLTNSTVSGNSAAFISGGGGILNYGGLTLTNSTVSSNSAAFTGGGMSNGGSLTLTNSTVSGNSAKYDAGGIENFDGSLTLSRSLVSGNTAPTAAEVSVSYLYSFTATFTLLGHKGLTTAEAIYGFTPDSSDLIATSDGTTPTALADILDTTLGDNGGPTRTHNLVVGSPAIDAAGATCDLTTDQRGFFRPFGPACDIGAIEFGSSPPTLDCSTATASVQFPQLGNRHRYPVTISGVTASPGNEVDITITTIFQDEPVTNPTGQTCPDGVGVGTAGAKVRNERLLAGDGRVYHIGFTATYGPGASCTGEVKACIPVNEGEACGDQGALFDSTTCP